MKNHTNTILLSSLNMSQVYSHMSHIAESTAHTCPQVTLTYCYLSKILCISLFSQLNSCFLDMKYKNQGYLYMFHKWGHKVYRGFGCCHRLISLRGKNPNIYYQAERELVCPCMIYKNQCFHHSLCNYHYIFDIDFQSSL
jgi:hypothetical protein